MRRRKWVAGGSITGMLEGGSRRARGPAGRKGSWVIDVGEGAGYREGHDARGLGLAGGLGRYWGIRDTDFWVRRTERSSQSWGKVGSGRSGGAQAGTVAEHVGGIGVMSREPGRAGSSNASVSSKRHMANPKGKHVVG